MANDHHDCRPNMAATIFPFPNDVLLSIVVITHDAVSQCEIEEGFDHEAQKSFHLLIKKPLTTWNHPDKPAIS
jgi:hypothetical protein